MHQKKPPSGRAVGQPRLRNLMVMEKTPSDRPDWCANALSENPKKVISVVRNGNRLVVHDRGQHWPWLRGRMCRLWRVQGRRLFSISLPCCTYHLVYIAAASVKPLTVACEERGTIFEKVDCIIVSLLLFRCSSLLFTIHTYNQSSS
jgi:hypothetical protein